MSSLAIPASSARLRRSASGRATNAANHNKPTQTQSPKPPPGSVEHAKRDYCEADDQQDRRAFDQDAGGERSPENCNDMNGQELRQACAAPSDKRGRARPSQPRCRAGELHRPWQAVPGPRAEAMLPSWPPRSAMRGAKRTRAPPSTSATRRRSRRIMTAVDRARCSPEPTLSRWPLQCLRRQSAAS